MENKKISAEEIEAQIKKLREVRKELVERQSAKTLKGLIVKKYNEIRTNKNLKVAQKNSKFVEEVKKILIEFEKV